MKLQNDDVGVNEVYFILKRSNVTRQIILRAVVLKYQSCLALLWLMKISVLITQDKFGVINLCASVKVNWLPGMGVGAALEYKRKRGWGVGNGRIEGLEMLVKLWGMKEKGWEGECEVLQVWLGESGDVCKCRSVWVYWGGSNWGSVRLSGMFKSLQSKSDIFPAVVLHTIGGTLASV